MSTKHPIEVLRNAKRAGRREPRYTERKAVEPEYTPEVLAKLSPAEKLRAAYKQREKEAAAEKKVEVTT